MGYVSNSQCVLQLMMNYYVEMRKMGVSMLSDGVGKPSQCVLQLMKTYYVKTAEMGASMLSDGVGKPFSVRPAADDEHYKH